MENKNLIIILYIISVLVISFFVLTFLYQYFAALGSLKNVVAAFGNDRILSALVLSIVSSIVTTVIAIILGVPLAYIFATEEFTGKSFIETLSIDVPQTFPPIAEGMIFLLMLGPDSPFHVNLAFTFIALVISKFFIAAPFIVSYVARRFREIKKTGLDLTARSLGANNFQVFMTIFVPMSLKDIAAGASLCWARAMGELGGSLLFGGVIPFKTETIPTFVATEANTLVAASLAATILATTASTLALLSFKRLTGGERR